MFKKWLICLFLIIYSFAFGYSEQVVVSQFDNYLKPSDKYKLEEKQLDKTYKNYPIQSGKSIKSITINGDSGLYNSIDFNYVDSTTFTYGSGNYSYAGNKKAIMIPFDKASNKDLRFSLTETYTTINESIITYLVEENFSLPIALGNLTKSNTQTGGVKLTYEETEATRKKHLKNYKKQEMMIRISKKGSNLKYDIMEQKNPYKPATITDNTDKFCTGSSSYMDFWIGEDNFYGQKNITAQNTDGTRKIDLRYMSGQIELFGLPNGDYNVEIYTFRYTKGLSSGSLIVTRESDIDFSINKDLKIDAVDVLSFSTEKFPKIVAKILTVCTSKNVSLEMQEAYDSGAFVKNSISTTPIPLTEVYINGVKTSLVDGQDTATGFYYYQWDVDVDSINKSIDNKDRKAKFILLDGATEKGNTQVEYVINISTELIVGYPHQTVYAYFPNGKAWTSPVDIDDRTMNRYSKGYKGIRLGSSDSLEKLYSGNSTKSQDLEFNTNSYLWEGNNENKNAVIIKKVKSDAKGTLNGGSRFTYYTQDWSNPNFQYVQELNLTKNETASFTWDSPERNSYTTVNTEKMIFRVVKGNGTTIVGGETFPNKYFSPEGNPLVTGENELLEFSNGNRDYVDIIFDAGVSSTKYSGKASFTYSDNSLIIRELPRGDYTVQIYAIQGEDSDAKAKNDFDYKVITYGAYKTFTIGLPEGVTGGFTNENNVYMINSTNVTPGIDVDTKEQFKDITVMFTTKAQKSLLLTTDNLVSRKDEAPVGLKKESIGLKVTEQKLTKNTNGTYSNKGNIENVSKLELSKGVGQLKFPLDIVIAIGSHGIGQQLIDNVKKGIKDASEKFGARGYDVRFNLIYYGSPLNIVMPTSSKYHAGKIGINDTWNKKVVFDDEISYPETSLSMIGNIDQLVKGKYTHMATFKSGKVETGDSINDYWFSDLTELNSALDSLTATGSYPYEDINSAWAIDRAADYLKKYGRYLNSNNEPVGFSEKVEGDIPSEKMLVLLTIKNMSSLNLPQKDVDGNPTGPKDVDGNRTGYTKDNVVAELSNKLSENKIKFSGIFRTGVYTDNQAKYEDKVTYTKSNAYYVNYDYTNKYNLEKYWIFNTPYGKFINAFNTWTGIGTINTVENIDVSKDYTLQRNSPLTASKIPITGGNTANVKVIQGYKLSIKDKLGISGNMPYTPSGKGINLADFAVQNMGSNFNMYEAGGTSENENVDAINITRAFQDIVNNVSIIQTWKMTYRSPFNLSDGDFREVIFSLNTKNILASKYDKTTKTFVEAPLEMTSKINPNSRIYSAPEIKIESYFVNPDKIKKTLIKKDGKIILEALSSSQYRKADGKIYNYPIIKGTFVIIDDKGNSYTVSSISSESTGGEKVSLADEKDANQKTWYRSKSSLNLKEFYKKFGRNPKLTISFTAETNEAIDTIVAEGLSLKDEDPPKITDFKMTNVTLSKFMSELKNSSSTGIFDMTKDDVKAKYTSTLAVTSDGGIAIGSFTDEKQLNIKDGDKVKIEFTIDDENVTASSTGIAITYNGVSYIAQHDPSDTATGLDSNGYPITKTRWVIGSDSNPVSQYIPIVTGKNSVIFNIFDDANPTNNPSALNNSGIGITLFKEPNLLQNTTLVAPTSTDRYTGDLNTAYYNSNNIDSNPVIGALAYLLVFDYDSSTADIGAPIESGTNIYATSGTKRWTSSVDGNFDFYDGKHTYNGTVYVMNSAGAILDITHNGTEGSPSTSLKSSIPSTGITVTNIVGAINIPTTNPNIFYVDTVAPVVKSISLEKTLDANGELNEPSLPKTNSLYNIIHGIIGETVTVAGGTNYKRPFKAGDNLRLTGTIAEKNIGKVIIGGQNIFADENYGVITGIEDYSKTGIAKDLGTPINVTKNVIVYDKAGNEAEYLTDGTNLTANEIQLTIAYDDRGPTALETKASVVDGLAVVGSAGGVSTKFTNDTNLPLTSSMGVPLSLVIVNNTVYGTVQTGTGNLKTILYSGAIPEDGLYTPTITTYSYSGVKGVTKTSTDNRIVLDTIVGGVDSNVVLKSTVPKITSTKLNEIFKNTLERVGLASYSINSVTPGVSGLKSGSSDYTANIKNPLSGALYSTAESKSSAITGEEELTFTVPSGGTYKFVITLYDRLGNWKDIDYIIEIPKNVKIIGKKKGYSNISIDTQVDNSTNVMKIKSRTE